jgi:hypothetical protein
MYILKICEYCINIKKTWILCVLKKFKYVLKIYKYVCIVKIGKYVLKYVICNINL